MAVVSSEESIIRERKMPSFHGLDFIRMFYKKSYAQPENLLSYHDAENSLVFQKNRRISEITCLLTPILQGGIALFAVFTTEFTSSWKIVRNRKEPVALPDSEQRLRFPEKSLILRNNLSPFHGTIHDRMISEKSHDSSSELMSIKCVRFICYIFRKIEYFMFQINVYSLCRV